MDLDLKQLGQTIATGGIAIFGILLLLRLFIHNFSLNQFALPGVQHFKFLYNAVYLATIFAAGILVEDLSKNYVAERPPRPVEWLFALLPKDEDLRFRSLYSDLQLSSLKDTMIKPKPLAIDLAERRIFERYGGKAGKRIQQLYNHESDSLMIDWPEYRVFTEEERDSIKAVVTRLYYHAHNTVYLQTTYFKELAKIESRLDFARSMFFLGIFLLTTHSILLTVYFVWIVLRPVFAVVVPSLEGVWKIALGKTFAKTHLPLLIVFGVGIYLGNIAFQSEHINYNLRIFGYFRSLDVNGKISITDTITSGQTNIEQR